MSQIDLVWRGSTGDGSPEPEPSSLGRALGGQRVNGTLWLMSELDDGVWLSRLLELTRPRPAQAVVVGLGVLCALRAVHAAGYAHGSLCAGEVRVGGDGQVRLGGWAAGALSGSAPRGSAPLEQRQRADRAAVGVLLAHLARAARRSPACAEEGVPALLAALDTAADQVTHPGAVIDLVAAPLEAACGPDDDAAARSELATLVRAATMSRSGSSLRAAGRPQPVAAAAEPAPSAVPGWPSAVPGWPGAVPGRRWAARLGAQVRRWWQRMWRWVVALLVLVVVVSLEFALLHERLTQDLQLLLGSGRSGQEATAPAGPVPVNLPPVPRPAPASAGAIGGLDLRALEPCLPGAPCAVRVLVQLHSQPQPVDQQPAPPRGVRWSFQVIDRCTGSQRSVPGGVVSAAPGDDQVQAVSTVPLPPGRALAVIAVTSEPATVASGALAVPARQGSCSGI